MLLLPEELPPVDEVVPSFEFVEVPDVSSWGEEDSVPIEDSVPTSSVELGELEELFPEDSVSAIFPTASFSIVEPSGNSIIKVSLVISVTSGSTTSDISRTEIARI